MEAVEVIRAEAKGGRTTLLTIPVAIELGKPLLELGDAALRESIVVRVRSSLEQLVDRLGIPGQPHVTLAGRSSTRALGVRVHGRLQPYSADLMRRTWAAFAPAPLRAQAWLRPATTDQQGFPDGWLSDLLADAQRRDHRHVQRVILEYIGQLVVMAICRQPGCLLADDQTRAYMDGSEARAATAQHAIADITTGLRRLLDLGLSVPDKAAILSLLGHGRGNLISVDEAVELAFSRLRSRRIEVHVDSSNVLALGQDGQAALASADAMMLQTLGLRLPRIEVLPTPVLPVGWITVQINSGSGLPMPGPGPDELLVDQPLMLAGMRIRGTFAIDPVGEGFLARVNPGDEPALPEGLQKTRPLEFFGLAVFGEAMRAPERLIGTDDVGLRLAELRSAYPKLVDAVVEDVPLWLLTSVLRQLVSERIPIRDLRRLLERLLQFETVPVQATDGQLFDERVAVVEQSSVPDWRQYVRFVRTGVGDLLLRTICRSGDGLMAVTLEPELERRFETADPTDRFGGLNDLEREWFLDAVWARTAEVEPGFVACVVTSASSRGVVARLIAQEMPTLPVIARAEVHGVEIRKVERPIGVLPTGG